MVLLYLLSSYFCKCLKFSIIKCFCKKKKMSDHTLLCKTLLQLCNSLCVKATMGQWPTRLFLMWHVLESHSLPHSSSFSHHSGILTIACICPRRTPISGLLHLLFSLPQMFILEIQHGSPQSDLDQMLSFQQTSLTTQNKITNSTNRTPYPLFLPCFSPEHLLF